MVVVLGFSSHSNAEVRQEGYFQDQGGNRIITYTFTRGEGEQALRKHVSELGFTKGQVFTVYYYPEGVKIPKDDAAPSSSRAFRISYQSTRH